MFTKAYLVGYTSMAFTSNDLDRLKYAPQRVEKGDLIDFKDNRILNVGQEIDYEIIPAKRVNEASRFTQALKKEYETGLKGLLELLDGGEDVGEDQPVETVIDRLYKVVAAGDKKAFRAMRKGIKEQLFTFNNEDVDDAIFDLADAVADKDVDFAKDIISDLEASAGGESKPEEDNSDKVVEDVKSVPAESEEVAEIIEDIKSAIDDGDEKDFKELIAELKEVSPKDFEEWKDAFVAPASEEESELVTEIVEDLEKATDEEEIKELLEELAEEAGEDSDIYKKWKEAKAPKKRRRRTE